jgi:hypothetical protein
MFSRIISGIIAVVGFLVAYNVLTIVPNSAIHQIYVTTNLMLSVLIFILAKMFWNKS